MKKAVSVVLFLIFAFWTATTAFAYENIIDDSANLFSDEEIGEITELADEFSDETGFSLAVATSDDYTVYDSEAFAAENHEDLVCSQGWSDNSVYLFIDVYNRTVSVSAIGSAGDLYGSYEIDAVIDSGFSSLSSGSYAEAAVLMIDAALELYNSYNYGGYYEGGYDQYTYDDYYYEPDYEYDYGTSDSFGFSDVMIYVVIGLVIGAISVFAVKSKYKNQGKGDEFDTDDVMLNLTGSNDTVISRNVVTSKIPRNNNHGRPGGSGGRTHSVGSRKF